VSASIARLQRSIEANAIRATFAGLSCDPS
jgi:hypothetical protein